MRSLRCIDSIPMQEESRRESKPSRSRSPQKRSLSRDGARRRQSPQKRIVSRGDDRRRRGSTISIGEDRRRHGSTTRSNSKDSRRARSTSKESRKNRSRKSDIPSRDSSPDSLTLAIQAKQARVNEYFSKSSQAKRDELDDYWVGAFKRNYSRRRSPERRRLSSIAQQA